MKQENSAIYPNRFSQGFDSYRDLLYHHQQQQQEQCERLSLPSDDSPDWSTTTSSSHNDQDDNDNNSDDNKYTEKYNPLSSGQITEYERHQIETFFTGLKTQVYVCNSLTNLYFKNSNETDWRLQYTGIPVVVLDIGESRARDKRRIQIVLAERGTGFMLWNDIIDNLSSYRVAGNAFHTMCYSVDHTKHVGISFDNAIAATEMWAHIDKLVSCPENISLSVPGKKKKRKERRKPINVPLPPKSQISQPCCFEHVTSIEKDDTNRYFSLQEYLPKGNNQNAATTTTVVVAAATATKQNPVENKTCFIPND